MKTWSSLGILFLTGFEGREQGGGVKMRLPFEPSLDAQEPRFYAPPPPRLPAKPHPPGNATPFEFDSPGQAT